MEWLLDYLTTSGREFRKLEALRKKSYRPRVFQDVEFNTLWFWREAQGTNYLNDLEKLAGKGQGTMS